MEPAAAARRPDRASGCRRAGRHPRIRDKQVRVPEELKLVFQKNAATPLVCPMPATFLVFNEMGTSRGR